MNLDNVLMNLVMHISLINDINFAADVPLKLNNLMKARLINLDFVLYILCH